MRESIAKTTETKSPDGHATVRWLSNNFFLDVSTKIAEFWRKCRWTVRRQSIQRSRGRLPTVKQLFFDVSEANWQKFWKKNLLNSQATVVGGHATVGRLSYDFFRRSKQFEKILKKVAERSRRNVVGGHTTGGWLLNNLFRRFSKNERNLEWRSLKRSGESRSEVTRPSADCQTTFISMF